MGEIVKRKSEKLPFEIRRALDALSGETEQAIVVTLLNHGRLPFSELRRELGDIHQQTLTNGLKSLQRGGLLRQRSTGSMDDRYDAYYEVSEYGERIVDRLLESLGSVDSFDGGDGAYEPVDNIHEDSDGAQLYLEGYHRKEHVIEK